MKKFITVEIPEKDNNGHRLAWWMPDMCLTIIDILEQENPEYDFLQIVTTGNLACNMKFALMKLKPLF
jgi:Ni2+-binding GTPase involved in maturation of urease and hydrogenase